jgi:hypothetical protein
MPFVVFRDDDRRRFEVTASGTLTFADFAQFMRLRTGEFREYTLLIDASAADAEVSTEELRAAADTARQADIAQGPRAGLAVVVSDDSLLRLGRMYEAFCQSAGIDTIRVFDSREAAERWLMERPAGARHQKNSV